MRFQFNPFPILKLIILSAAFIIGAIPVSAMAIEVDLTRFLSDYERASGSPSASTDSFFGVAGAGRLIVVNGNDIDLESRVTSAVIMLNGEKVLGPGSFDEEVTEIEIPVELVGAITPPE
jgi:hypothetical protein